MGLYEYFLGAQSDLEKFFPAPNLLNPDLGLHSFADVVGHFTNQSLKADGFIDASAKVELNAGQVIVALHNMPDEDTAAIFSDLHQQFFSAENAGMALNGKALLEQLNVWNPMEGYPVNGNPADGDCKWHLFPPLGLNVMGQMGMLLMHYPPWQALENATFIDCMTVHRWNTILHAVGIPTDQVSFYRTIVDVNPIAAPGSGQSEYPNDYFPIMMASAFFDGAPDRNYIRGMLGFYLNGPNAAGEEYTLPLLVCGSPLYDPQAPGWFRTAFKEEMPTDENGTPVSNVLQTGSVQINPAYPRKTPYMIANHMIAAGVTGRCTDDPSKIPDIRMYEAQDCTAASFLYEYVQNPNIDPAEAKARAATRWFGNPEGIGPPTPPDPKDAQILCALAQMDLYFSPTPTPHPTYTFEEAMERCAGAENKTCGCKIGPGSGDDGAP